MVKPAAPSIERQPWSEVARHLRRYWEPGQHFGVYAPTGHGKTVLTVRGLLPRWTHTVTFDVKGDDPELARSGKRVRTFPSRVQLKASALAREQGRGDNPAQRYRLNPGGMGERDRTAFTNALNEMWSLSRTRKTKGSWTVNLDEARILADNMGMRKDLQKLLVLGRSRGLTVISGSQAPRMLPSECYDQPRWFALGPFRDKRTVDRFGEIGGDTDMIRAVLPSLDYTPRKREFLFLGPENYTAIASWSA